MVLIARIAGECAPSSYSEAGILRESIIARGPNAAPGLLAEIRGGPRSRREFTHCPARHEARALRDCPRQKPRAGPWLKSSGSARNPPFASESGITVRR